MNTYLTELRIEQLKQALVPVPFSESFCFFLPQSVLFLFEKHFVPLRTGTYWVYKKTQSRTKLRMHSFYIFVYSTLFLLVDYFIYLVYKTYHIL